MNASFSVGLGNGILMSIHRTYWTFIGFDWINSSLTMIFEMHFKATLTPE